MVERSSVASSCEKPAEELVLFKKAIEKTGTLSLPNRTTLPRGLVAARAKLQPSVFQVSAANSTPVIGNWFWSIG